MRENEDFMDLANIFYKEIVGIYPFPTNREEAITRCTLAYLLDSGITEKEILKILPIFKNKAVISPDILPDALWHNSLTEKNIYYCHHALQIIPPAPIIKNDGTFKEFPFYLEIKIRFTVENLLQYFYRKASNYHMIKDSKRDCAQLMHMLNRYKKIEDIQGLDLLLFMIDEAAYRHIIITEPFDIKTSEVEVFTLTKLRNVINNRRKKKHDKIKYRNYIIYDGEMVWKIS